MRVTRKKKPKVIQFMNDLARRTLDRRAEKIPEMLEYRKNGKTAFMIMDKLIVYDQKPPDKDLLAVPMETMVKMTLALVRTVVMLLVLNVFSKFRSVGSVLFYHFVGLVFFSFCSDIYIANQISK